MKRIIKIVIILAVMLGGATLAAAQTEINGYSITRWTIDGGGGTSDGSGYSLSGSIGQAAAGQVSGGGYSLTSGYWASVPAANPGYMLYLPFTGREH